MYDIIWIKRVAANRQIFFIYNIGLVNVANSWHHINPEIPFNKSNKFFMILKCLPSGSRGLDWSSTGIEGDRQETPCYKARLEGRQKILFPGKREGNRNRFRGSSSRIAAADGFRGGGGGGKDRRRRRRRFRRFLPRVQPAGRIFNMLVKNVVRISGSKWFYPSFICVFSLFYFS